MSFCVKCGAQLVNGAAFCRSCGARQAAASAPEAAPANRAPQAAPASQAPQATSAYQAPQAASTYQAPDYQAPQQANRSRPVRKLHCPECKSYNITVTTESSVNGGLTTSRGNMAVTTMSNTHRNFWICSDCGTKFRNIQNLDEEIVTNRKGSKICMVVAIIAAIISAFLLISSAKNPIGGLIMIGFTMTAVVVAVVCFCFIFVYNNRADKLEQEKAYLKKNCFD